MIAQGGVLLDELGIHHVVAEDADLGLLHGQAHFRRHPYFVPFNYELVLSVHEKRPAEYWFQLTPWVNVQEHVEAFDEDDLMLLAVILDLAFLRVLLRVVKVWENSVTIMVRCFDILHESFGIESELGSSPGVSVLRVLHLVELPPVVVVAVHGHDEGLDVVLLAQNSFHFLAEVALARGTGTGHADKWDRSAVIYQLNYVLRDLNLGGIPRNVTLIAARVGGVNLLE